MIDFAADLEARFVRYVQIDTQSDENSSSVPSTSKQFDLLNLLREELEELGAADVRVTEKAIAIATIPATTEVGVPRVAFLAHVDSTQQFNATGVKPIFHRNYDGSPITLPDDDSQVLLPEANPYLRLKLGEDIITASGTTLLSADDKAGVAIIMTLAKHLLAHPEVPHGELRVCFTPDEEIGRGTDYLELEELAVDYAYTLDGGALGEITYESFSADKAVINITGVSIHPGYAFGQLVNAQQLAAKIIMLLPQHTRTPETTSGREGFIHLTHMAGSAAHIQLTFILRDFELGGLAAYGQLIHQVCAAVQASEPRAKVECVITPQYRNMRYWLEKDMRPVEVAMRAMRELGIEPISEPIRGGTDGSKLTERGLLTPNIFTGMQNLHGPLEWISVQDMAKGVAVCVELVQEWGRAS
ncbi:MAG: peptidase T [Herpetosiphonaceae bacterium]|nr:peptidase T [Herpetosiphonaceae bacterium]